MKRNKKITCMLIALMLSLSMAACAAPDSVGETEVLPSTESVNPENPTDKGSATETSGDIEAKKKGEITPRITKDENPYGMTNDIDSLSEDKKSLSGEAGVMEDAYFAEEGAAADIGTAKAEAPLTRHDGIPDPGTDIPDILTEPDTDIADNLPEPQAGLLTAGEWNDNANWGFFTNLVNTDAITFPSFGIDPRYRTKVELTGSDGKALKNAKVELLDGENKIWAAVTDNKGVAYLFASAGGQGTDIQVSCGGKTQKYSLESNQKPPVVSSTDAQTQQGGGLAGGAEVALTFDGTGETYQKTDIMFIMDATGSMSDEMLFLQSEFTAISEAAGDDNTRYSVNFYRDKGDDFTTKCYDFTDDVKGLQEKLNSESADGGGDTPEAVAEILEETMMKNDWDDDAVKIAFMIFDAPPHEGTEQSLLSSVKAAAEKGIRLIPVISSGSERDTELFGRAMAIVTNGTYVFLTDDSGIGYSHLEPIIGDYQTEKLYDIIIRIINNYRQ